MPRRALTIALTIVAVSAAVFLLQFTASVLIPLVVSLLLFYALDPVVSRLVKWHVPRAPAALSSDLSNRIAMNVGIASSAAATRVSPRSKLS